MFYQLNYSRPTLSCAVINQAPCPRRRTHEDSRLLQTDDRLCGAEDGTRTRTPLRTQAPQACLSTKFQHLGGLRLRIENKSDYRFAPRPCQFREPCAHPVSPGYHRLAGLKPVDPRTTSRLRRCRPFQPGTADILEEVEARPFAYMRIPGRSNPTVRLTVPLC